jgi:hypothetical protein
VSHSVRFRRLLDRGFYPKELPPVFRTSQFGAAGQAVVANSPTNYVGHTNYVDGATFQGNHRTFGVINPVNYCLLAAHISTNWADISRSLRRSRSSLFSVKFPRRLDATGRSFEKVAFSEKLERQRELSASYPATLHLDINRFYGSIYTHSIPWAVLGKQTAKTRHRTHATPAHWSEELDKLQRNCNDAQTIGIPIGPDTSRIVSEILLSAIDIELTENGSGVASTSFVHSIDDFEFGVYDSAGAERVSALFERAIRRYELRSNERKKSFVQAAKTDLGLWQHRFDSIRVGSNFVDSFFSLVWELWQAHPEANVVAYALQRFRREIARSTSRPSIVKHLFRILFASPHLVQWIAPFLVGLKSSQHAPVQLNRLLDWGVEEAARRHDTITVLWFIYLHLHFDKKILARNLEACLGIESALLDLMILHARHNALTSGGHAELTARYNGASLRSDSWLYIYESERRGWQNFVGGSLIGTPQDQSMIYQDFKIRNVSFYDSSAFGVPNFDFALIEADFDLEAIASEDFYGDDGATEVWTDY